MGWLPIGDCGSNNKCGEADNNDDNYFSSVFEGNGHTISNLYSKRTDKLVRFIWFVRVVLLKYET